MKKSKHFSKEFSPLKIGESRKVYLKNGSSITTKWKSENSYIIRYKPENHTNYYAPYFLLKFKKGILITFIPYPNKRSFIVAIVAIIGLIYFKEIKTDLYFMLFSFALIFSFLMQALVTIPSYKIIKKKILEKDL
tara:strand:- start:1 stop:405 length:405 start_codon:yes stop_codon:yes gene_type:complete